MPKASIAATLADLIDKAAVYDVVSTYAGAMDRREWSLYRSIFTDEVDIHFPVWTGGLQERVPAERWVDLVRKALTGFDATHHMIVNRGIKLQGDRATVDSHMTARHVYAPDEVEFLGGFYTHQLVRRKGEWKLSGVMLNITWDEGPRELFPRAYKRGESRVAAGATSE
jgi:hypothetical protein